MKRLQLPPSAGQLEDLEAGEDLLLSGTVYTTRDTTLLRMEEIAGRGEQPPVTLEGQVVFLAGPAPAPPGASHSSIGPTTAARMAHFIPLLNEMGVVAMVGKGPLGPEGLESARRYRLLYLAAIGGAAAYFSTRVSGMEVMAFPDLGPEAVIRVEMKEFPVVVAVDLEGNDFIGNEIEKYGREMRRGLT